MTGAQVKVVLSILRPYPLSTHGAEVQDVSFLQQSDHCHFLAEFALDKHHIETFSHDTTLNFLFLIMCIGVGWQIFSGMETHSYEFQTYKESDHLFWCRFTSYRWPTFSSWKSKLSFPVTFLSQSISQMRTPLGSAAFWGTQSDFCIPFCP